MAITELVFPAFKTDQASLEEIERDLPIFGKQMLNPNPGIYNAFSGRVLSEGDKDVRGDYKRFSLFGKYISTAARPRHGSYIAIAITN